jgi:hypothetical protein
LPTEHERHLLVGRSVDFPSKFAKIIVKNLISFYHSVMALMIAEGKVRKAKIIGRVTNASFIKMKPHYQCSERIALTSEREVYAVLVHLR